MCKKQHPRSSSLERRVQIYPPPKYFGLFTAYARANEMRESEAAVHMIRCFFDAMPEGERIRIVKFKTLNF